jgi:uncharacterized membrane protein YdjX (TVP38/TMEM64 family)
MFLTGVEIRLIATLTRRADRPAFALVVAAVAFAATLSMVVPFGSLLAGAVLMAPRRWKSIAICSSLGAALGAALIFLVFHHLGWERLVANYPDVVGSAAWSDATRWLTSYGVASLLVVAALPLPLTPALIFAAISRLPVTEVLFALWLGKVAKYLAYAWLASVFPGHVLRKGQVRLATLHDALIRAGAARDPTSVRRLPNSKAP